MQAQVSWEKNRYQVAAVATPVANKTGQVSSMAAPLDQMLIA